MSSFVIGGGVAGLSGALMLGRARRSVFVIDGGQPRNRFTAKMHGVLGRDATSPADLLADGRREVAAYGAVIRPGSVTCAERTETGFTISFTDADTGEASQVRARRALVATGLRDGLPEIGGEHQGEHSAAYLGIYLAVTGE